MTAADDLRRFALQLHGWGARVAALGPDKRPVHKWAAGRDEPQTREEAAGLPWGRARAVGVVCGPGGWRAFDVDAVKEEGARPVGGDVRRALLEGLGLPIDYQWAQTTPRGGLHVFFRCDDPRPGDWPGGGVIVGEPGDPAAFAQLELRWERSLVTVAGAGYSWLRNDEPFVTPALLPWAAVERAFCAVADRPVKRGMTIRQTAGRGYGEAALADAMRQVAGAPEGARNARLFAQAAGVLELANGGEIALVEVERGMTAAGLAAGLGEDEVEATLESAKRRTAGKARTAAAITFPPSSNGHGANGSGAVPDVSAVLHLHPTSLADLLATYMAPLEWLVEGLVARGQLVLLAGRPKSGKSWLALALAQAIDSGRLFLNRETRRGRVLLVALEDGPRRLRGRVETLGWQPARVDVLFELARLDGDGVNPGPGLVQLAGAAPDYDLIVIDTLIAGLSGRADENSNPAMAAVANELAAIARTSDTTILLIHHTSKATHEDIFHTIRGASALRGSYDAGWVLDRKREEREALLHMESKDADNTTFTIRQAEGGAGWQLLGSGVELGNIRAGRKVVEALQNEGDGVTADELAKTLGITRQAAGKQLRAAEAAGVVRRERQQGGQGLLLEDGGGPPRKEADLWFLA